VLPGVEPPADEELTSGTSWKPRLALGLLAGALVAALLGARLLQDHDNASPAAAASSPAVAHRNTAALVVDTPRDCPAAGDGQTVCRTSSHVPAAVLAAVRARFPQARRVDAVEERLRDIGFGTGGLWYRALSATEGDRAILVVVRRRTADDGPFVRTSDTGLADRIQIARLADRQMVVVATVSAPHGTLPALAVVRALVDDPRLLTGVGT
jgi:hypothetical protein